MTRYYFKVSKMVFPVDGYNYNVQVFRSVDGHNFYYCGIGKHCKTNADCEAYMNEYREAHREEIETK